MYTSIVVGTDGSDTARTAVEHAARLAREQGARLHVVSAYSGGMTDDQAALVASGAGDGDVNSDTRGVDTQTHVLAGEPADALIETAAAIGAELIVVGSKGLGGVKGFLLGSVPAKVARDAPCSVLIVRTDT